MSVCRYVPISDSSLAISPLFVSALSFFLTPEYDSTMIAIATFITTSTANPTKAMKNSGPIML
jgi:hypothetical protein